MNIPSFVGRRIRSLSVFTLVLLVIEFLDEFVFGAEQAALPLIRTDLGLNYAQVGLLLTIPPLLANVIFEPALGVLGDVWKRRILILGGGIGCMVALLLTASSHSFATLLIAFIIFNPSSGAFVGLAQSTLMDIAPTRHEQNMARWTFAGSIGVVGGSLLLGVLVSLGLGWRAFFWLALLLMAITWIVLWRLPFPKTNGSDDSEEAQIGFIQGLRRALGALRRFEVVRWLVLLEFSDFMLDILYGYLALYFVDVVGVSEVQAGFAVAVWTGVGLAGDLALIYILERVPGIRYLRFSAALEFVLYTLFLIVPGLVPKLILIGMIGFFNAGWYSILKGNLYSSLPGQSGSVMTLGNISGLISTLVPLMIGLAAERFGLQAAMIFPLIGCVALLVGLPRKEPVKNSDSSEIQKSDGEMQGVE